MPNIKRKPFHLTGKTCYKCYMPIEYLTLNWTYNTRRAGNFAHQDCNIPAPGVPTTPETSPEPITVTLPENTPKPTTEPIHLPIIQPPDIVDRITLDRKHWIVEEIKMLLRANPDNSRDNILMHGCPGSGKSFLVEQIADDMGLESLTISCSEDMFKSEILGSKSPINGVYFPVKFVELWKGGGVVLFDEAAMSNGNFLNVLNNAMANKKLAFPNGETIKMHKNFFMLFADNSNLWGDDPLFPERMDSGQAFRDRLTYLEMGPDEKIELMVLTHLFQGDKRRAKEWHEAVKVMRREISSEQPVFASSRFAYRSANHFRKGATFKKACKYNLWQGRQSVDPDMINTVLQSISIDPERRF